MSNRIEVVSRVSGRRRWTVEQKLAALRDAFGPEGCVRTACERHEVGSGSIYTWRRQAMSGELTGVRKPIEPAFAEVQISEQLALPAPTVAARSNGVIGIELPSGIKVSVDATVDADALSRVIGVLAR
ncbi:transposase [Sphingobium sp. Leaf26]|uniref:transposase n=1 Tax=Sphingobium sp. Leaf26 TaxID=1735693 RepID=UPI0006F5DD36|nr:transposase [Sphingobium sp. Leaf26]KQM99285.1 transposase [Sphingobium sp. Leaf26]